MVKQLIWRAIQTAHLAMEVKLVLKQDSLLQMAIVTLDTSAPQVLGLQDQIRMILLRSQWEESA